MTQRTLEAIKISKSYGKKPVLKEVSVHLSQGEIVGLLGPNGAGKTTCFYVLCGLIKPDRGSVLMDGMDITSLPLYRRARLGIGYLPQEASIFRGLSVEDNIRVALEAIQLPKREREKALQELLEEFSITHLSKSPAVSLSGGERRRVEIARALASRPKFILFDEPLAGVDPIAVKDIRSLIFHLKNKGIGILITDHNVRETLDIVDRSYILNDGHILAEGKPKDIISHEEVRRVYLGDTFTRNKGI